jgi:hypothetical protein
MAAAKRLTLGAASARLAASHEQLDASEAEGANEQGRKRSEKCWPKSSSPQFRKVGVHAHCGQCGRQHERRRQH